MRQRRTNELVDDIRPRCLCDPSRLRLRLILPAGCRTFMSGGLLVAKPPHFLKGSRVALIQPESDSFAFRFGGFA
jgi:hypothetical protein